MTRPSDTPAEHDRLWYVLHILCEDFPGLMDGETEIDGGELIEALTNLVQTHLGTGTLEDENGNYRGENRAIHK